MHELIRNIEAGQLAFQVLLSEAGAFSARLFEERMYEKKAMEIISPPNDCMVYPYSSQEGIKRFMIDHPGFIDLTFYVKDRSPIKKLVGDVYSKSNAQKCLNCCSSDTARRVTNVAIVLVDKVDTRLFVGWVTYFEVSSCGSVKLPSYELSSTSSRSVDAGVSRAISNAIGGPS